MKTWTQNVYQWNVYLVEINFDALTTFAVGS